LAFAETTTQSKHQPDGLVGNARIVSAGGDCRHTTEIPNGIHVDALESDASPRNDLQLRKGCQ
jgi:hypothetical protein